MANHDTVELLKECDSGVKMAISAIDEVLPKARTPELACVLNDSREEHRKLGLRAEKLLAESGSAGQSPNPAASGMSWLKTNAMLAWNESDSMISDLITDGCGMGIKSLRKYLNKYESADGDAKTVANDLINTEKALSESISCFL